MMLLPMQAEVEGTHDPLIDAGRPTYVQVSGIWIPIIK